MKSLILALVFVGSVSSFNLFNKEDTESDGGTIWAVLVAGSNTWINYRHQADISHAFHVLKNHGIQEKHIITMMYDDIVNDPENPFPGKLFNGPDGENGTNYYEGVKIDYRGESVNPENFLAILQGEADKIDGGNGRVLKSTKNDKVFVYFSDHGGPGTICFPNSVLAANDLKTALVNMHSKNMYKELVFYVEACYSGSMFDKILPTNINVYVVTAANNSESSYASYCRVGGKLNGVCLGDLFSINWMQDSDKKNLKEETLQKQFEIVKKKTNESHVKQFGSLKITKEPVANFQGNEKGPSIQHDNTKYGQSYGSWPALEVPLKMLEHKLEKTNDKNEISSISKQLNELKEKREYLRAHMESLVKKLVSDKETQESMMNKNTGVITKLECHSEVMHAYNDMCFNFGRNSYASVYAKALVNLCESGMNSKKIIQTLKGHCKDIKYQNIV